MTILTGIGVSSGIIEGRIKYYHKRSYNPDSFSHAADNPETERKRMQLAIESTNEQLAILAQKAKDNAGESAALLFETHQLMLEDEDLIDTLYRLIEDRNTAEKAVFDTVEQYSEFFSQMDSDYMKARAQDIKDIGQRLISNLCGSANTTDEFEDGISYVLVSDDLSPSETIQMDKNKILAFVMSDGTPNSHTAILAKTLGIPAVMQVGAQIYDYSDGSEIFVDGSNGKVYVNPNEDIKNALIERIRVQQFDKKTLLSLKGLPNKTKSGKIVDVYANIGNPQDVEAVIENDAGGIGLYRTEFLFLKENNYPSEEIQFEAYKSVVESMDGKQVVIRTLDIGADKKADYFRLKDEENPALGLRAIRICLTRPDVFKTQLRAIYRASAYGNVAIMFPMITSVWEIKEAKKICALIEKELDSENIEYCHNIQIGIMVETPAAAIISNRLAAEVDFFSIGTNDLTQYTLAIDRQSSPELEKFYDAHHPAVLELIKKTADAAHEAGIWCGICGEMAGDLTLTEYFMSINIDELSVPAPKVLKLRSAIRNLK